MQYRIKQFLGNIPAANLAAEKQKLAELLDVSVTQLNRLARGDNEPSGKQLWIIANFFGVSVSDLYEKEVQLEPAA